MNICKYANCCIPAEFTVFQNDNCIHRKNISCYQVAMVTLFWAQRIKLDAKYSTRVCKMKSLPRSLLPPLNYNGLCQDNDVSLKLSFLISIFLNLPFLVQRKIEGK